MAKPVWRDIFIQIAIRAIVDVQHKYGIWEFGQVDELLIDHFENLNYGDGFFLAPETTVRDAITMQMLETGLFKEQKIVGEGRSYVINREFYLNDGTRNFVDIVFKRIQKTAKNGDKTYPVLIEAKRYEIFNYDKKEKKIKRIKDQITDIKDDIKKLRYLYAHIKNNKFEFDNFEFDDAYLYLLIWGKGESWFSKDTLIANLGICKDVNDANSIFKTIPLTWSDDATAKKITVKSFIWIALLEIIPPSRSRFCPMSIVY